MDLRNGSDRRHTNKENKVAGPELCIPALGGFLAVHKRPTWEERGSAGHKANHFRYLSSTGYRVEGVSLSKNRDSGVAVPSAQDTANAKSRN